MSSLEICAWCRRYSPVINYVLWIVTAIGFCFLHFDLKRHNYDLYEKSSSERMALFQERDAMIIQLMTVRTEAVNRAVEQITRNADSIEKAVAFMEVLEANQEEILSRLPAPTN